MKLPRLVLPFASITERPYDQALLKDVDWYAIAPTYVQLADINLTQTHCTILGLFGQRYSTDPRVRLVQWEERLYCEDGHHRLVEQAIQRVPIHTTLARVHRLHSAGTPMQAWQWPDTMRMTRGSWAALQFPNKQPGGRYWPNGTGSPEYTFHSDDAIFNVGLPVPDQVIVFKRRK